MGNRLDVLSNMHIRREYVYGPGIDNPIAMITFYDDELVGLYFYHTDALGSVIAMTSVNGVVAEKYRYSPFGRTTIYDGSGGEIARSAIGNPYMFTARRLDEESGLYYYRARMYKPEIGRFLQTDPLGYIDTINPYAYCANNPLNWVDPWGLRYGCKVKRRPNDSLKVVIRGGKWTFDYIGKIISPANWFIWSTGNGECPLAPPPFPDMDDIIKPESEFPGSREGGTKIEQDMFPTDTGGMYA